MDIEKAINSINIDLDKIADPASRVIIAQLLNIIEYLVQENKELKEENQRLRDENNRLKGEQGKPNIRPQAKSSKDVSSESERKRRKKKKLKKSKSKKHKIKVDRTVVCKVDETQLPSDVIFKGYTSVVVQDIIIKTDNIEFKKELYYSPSLNKTFMASLPGEYQGEFGPNLKALIIGLHSVSKMTEPAIAQFLGNHGILISGSSVSRIITDNHEPFHQEKKDIVQAGLSSAIYQQMDDTGARVGGKNFYTHILCNEHYTAYFTRPNKSRLTILEILTQGELTFQFNESAYALMEQMKLSEKILNKLRLLQPETKMYRVGVDNILTTLFPDQNKHKTNRRIIIEASAIVAYQQLPNAVNLLITDDAPQFKQIVQLLALCWIHDGRHYKKLEPVVQLHAKQLKDFLDKYWQYYHQLLDYKRSPTALLARTLSSEFDVLFSTKTGYEQLDVRIEKTMAKKESLLLSLKYPGIPLHNNASELGARTQARYRDISLQTQNAKGTEAKDTFMTIVETAKKLGVNAFEYIRDRISKKLEMPSLSDIVAANVGKTAYNTS